ncbi:MAG TPA: hypothetical protein VGM69_17885 [Chloroflexota bacterium]|jgi:integrase
MLEKSYENAIDLTVARRAARCAKQLHHSFGTNLRRAGVGLDTTSRLVGHRRVSTTADVYIQPVTELELAAVDELERLVGGADRAD